MASHDLYPLFRISNNNKKPGKLRSKYCTKLLFKVFSRQMAACMKQITSNCFSLYYLLIRHMAFVFTLSWLGNLASLPFTAVGKVHMTENEKEIMNYHVDT